MVVQLTGYKYLFGCFYVHLARQEVAFFEKAREIKGCGSLKRDFYTKFKPKN